MPWKPNQNGKLFLFLNILTPVLSKRRNHHILLKQKSKRRKETVLEVNVITLKPDLGKKLLVAKLSNFTTQLKEERPGFTAIQYLTQRICSLYLFWLFDILKLILGNEEFESQLCFSTLIWVSLKAPWKHSNTGETPVPKLHVRAEGVGLSEPYPKPCLR